MDKNCANGFRAAVRITRSNAKTFYFASFFLPKESKNAAYAIYAVCRLSDDSVDKVSGALRHNELTEIERGITLAYGDSPLTDPLLCAFRRTVREYDIPESYFYELLSGMRMDLEKNRYAGFNALYDYCYKVAGVVGLIMLKVFKGSGDTAKKHAEELGVAMQLTNILRDIREDFLMGRIYLPQDEMRRFGVSEEDIARANISENFRSLMRFQIQRARDHYNRSLAGIPLIPGRRNRLVVLAMHELYSGILDAIVANKYDVFSGRAQVKTGAKILRAVKLLLKGGYL